MPSTSKSQQRLMGVAYAVKSGDMQLSDVDAEYRDKVKDLVDGMTLKQLKDFAETKHKGLPEKKIKENMSTIKSFDQFIAEAYDGNMSDFKTEFPLKFEEATGNPVKAIKKMSKKGKGYEVRTSIYMSRPEMAKVGRAMGLELVSYEKSSSVAITIYE